MSLDSKRQEMPHQDPKTRIENFDEVALGYKTEQALLESERCLNCKSSPCISGCPVNIDIRAFIQAIKQKDYLKSYQILKTSNNLPGICGRVCPQETQCEQACILYKQKKPIAIGRLERFVADWAIANDIDKQYKQTKGPDKQKVGVIGSGPAGLTCGADLAKQGFDVTIFEGLHQAGGVLRYGIPEFRLPNDILDLEINFIKALGAKIELNVVIGKTRTIDELKAQGFKAFFIATGAGLPYFLGIPGENLNGVYSANEFLTRINLMKAYKFPEYETPISVGEHVCVIGAGNVAIDCARAALRLKVKKVTVVYRRSQKEMPARQEEIENAKQEGIEFKLLSSPLKIVGDKEGNVTKMVCIKNELSEPDDSGRRRPVAVEGSEFTIDVQTVVCAIGQGPNPLLLSSLPDLKLNRKGNIEVDKNLQTSMPGIYAGGDIVSGAATVIQAMQSGKIAAKSIASFLDV
jgi:glutamate synthase (NADPH/NADH) small chain